MTDDEKVEAGIEAVYHMIRDSFELALVALFGEGEDAPDIAGEVLLTVDDAVVNHWDELVEAFYGS